jgi:hypothetical protein
MYEAEVNSRIEFIDALPAAVVSCFADRLFVDGMVRIDLDEGPIPYLLKVRFKQWGKLWTVGNLALHPLPDVQRREKRNILVGAIAFFTEVVRRTVVSGAKILPVSQALAEAHGVQGTRPCQEVAAAARRRSSYETLGPFFLSAPS